MLPNFLVIPKLQKKKTALNSSRFAQMLLVCLALSPPLLLFRLLFFPFYFCIVCFLGFRIIKNLSLLTDIKKFRQMIRFLVENFFLINFLFHQLSCVLARLSVAAFAHHCVCLQIVMRQICCERKIFLPFLSVFKFSSSFVIVQTTVARKIAQSSGSQFLSPFSSAHVLYATIK
jgi:hypothetical protein